MANLEHLEILKQGVEIWNKWRQTPSGNAHNLINADLSGADLNGMNCRQLNLSLANLRNTHFYRANLLEANFYNADLYGADLTHANLIRADLRNTNLIRSSLRNADLNGADLSWASLSDADLSSANLYGANLRGTYLNRAAISNSDLRKVNLSDADLRGAKFITTHLKGARFNLAITANTLFNDLDLREAIALELIQYSGPSEISISTIYRSGGNIPEVFLRGCGLRDWEIEATKLYRTDLSKNQLIDLTYKVIELRTDPLIQFNSCFISYSSRDEVFARHLYSDLQNSGVRCWFAPEDMKIGDRIRPRIDDSIRLHDKLLLILSKTSIDSQWIEQEVETALEKERERGCNVLFPIRLDNTVMNVKSGWPALIKKTRHIGDFCKSL